MKKSAAENNYLIKVFVTVKTCSSFLNYVSSTSLDIALKVSSMESKEEELFYCWKVSKFLLAAFFANARRVDVSKFWVERTAILRLRPPKLIFLRFSKIKGFLLTPQYKIRSQHGDQVQIHFNQTGLYFASNLRASIQTSPSPVSQFSFSPSPPLTFYWPPPRPSLHVSAIHILFLKMYLTMVAFASLH